MTKEIVILTKSSKFGGLCVAGIDINNGKWVRLTTDDENTHGAVQKRDMCYENGEYCKILDIVKIVVKKENPTEYQPENILIDRDYIWKKNGESSIEKVLKIHPPEHHLFLLGNQYSYITEAKVSTVGHSLELVKINNLIIKQAKNPDGNPKTKAGFYYGMYTYENMSVTDSEYYSIPDQTKVGNAVIVASLPDSPFPEGKYYKFIAQIYQI